MRMQIKNTYQMNQTLKNTSYDLPNGFSLELINMPTLYQLMVIFCMQLLFKTQMFYIIQE